MEDVNKLQKRMDKNRAEIDYLLHKDLPLDFIYMRINMLSSQNKSIIDRIEKNQPSNKTK